MIHSVHIARCRGLALGAIAASFLTTPCWSQGIHKQGAQTQIAAKRQPLITSADISFTNADAILRGTLVRPRHPVAAVIIVHGSGQEKRMTDFAELLAKKGIAALTYDKRGVGDSGGVYVGPEVGTNNVDPTNLALLASDAHAAVMKLTKLLAARPVPIGLLGFSQAGWVIPLAAVKDRRVKFMVLFSGPVATTLEQLRFQFYTESDPKFWDSHSEADARLHAREDADRYQFVATDPQSALGKLSIPGLWLFGGRDVQIPTGLSIERLDLMKKQGKCFQHHLFPALDHNTAFADDTEPVTFSVKWIKASARKGCVRALKSGK